MENKETILSEEWIKIVKDDIPEGEYVVTSLIQDTNGTKILLDDEQYMINIFFDGIPVLIRSAVEGIRMQTWGNVQLKYNDKFIFRKSFFFEIKNSDLIKWCIQESCGLYEEYQLKHYCIVTSEEMIDIVSTFEPTVQVSLSPK